MLVLKYQVWKVYFKTRILKPSDRQTQHKFCHSIYTFHRGSVKFPYMLSTCIKFPVTADQINSDDSLAIRPEILTLNILSLSTYKLSPDGYC